MSIALQRGLLRNLALTRSQQRTEQEVLVDVVFMAVLADGLSSDAKIEQAAKTLESYAEIQGLPGERLRARAEELRLDAPFFSDVRADIATDLVHGPTRRLALTLAAKVAAGSRPLESEELAVLQALGTDFAIPEREREHLIQPWTRGGGAGAPKGYRVCGFNDPASRPVISVFDYLGHAPGNDQFVLAMHKLHAIRGVMSRWFESGEIVAAGESIGIGPHFFRIDAYLTWQDQRLLFRFLAPGEALHPLERDIIELLVYRLEVGAKMILVPAGVLAPEDWALVREVNSPSLEVLSMS